MDIILHENDLPEGLDLGTAVAIDTETMGLQHHRDRLCLVQLSAGDGTCHLVHMHPEEATTGPLGPLPLLKAPNLCRLLSDRNVLKIFHYGRFDIAALVQNLGVLTTNVYCTKIASRLVRTFTSQHSLKDLCRDLLEITLDKAEQTSDWGAPHLTPDQQRYAATDVLYLHALREQLDALLAREGKTEIAQACFRFLPYRALLDLQVHEEFDIFAHRS